MTKAKEIPPFPVLARAFLACLVVERRRGDCLQTPAEHVITALGVEARGDVLEWLGAPHDPFECPLA